MDRPADAADHVGDTSTRPDGPGVTAERSRRESASQHSQTSQTAAEFIREQMQMEADAREALPYSIENCTKPLGPLRQSVFACLTCNPPPLNPSDAYNAAGVCYSCSVQCHGEHTLVEIFNKRNFTCDCGTTRFPATSPCSLRINSETNAKGDVHSEPADPNNKYNQNFRNRFCGCECDYDPFEQKGTMFQCLGLGTYETGGCGEDWWHPDCVVGLGPKWYEKMEKKKNVEVAATSSNTQPAPSYNGLATISEDAEATPAEPTPTGVEEADEDEELPMPPGFPAEDDFEGFLCYKCVEANPWIKRYAGSRGFLPAVFLRTDSPGEKLSTNAPEAESPKKRKADDEDDGFRGTKRVRSEPETSHQTPITVGSLAEDVIDTTKVCKLTSLPAAPEGRFSLFFTDSFRDQLCHCSDCFPLLKPHPQLLEEEETYEPPISEIGSDAGGSTHGSGSLYERGESALRNVDRVRAIEGVMAYNHLKEQLTPFFKQFAESGKAIGAEDIKEYFAKLRGDADAIKEAGESAKSDFRQEQSGY